MSAILSNEILAGYFDEVQGYVPELSQGLQKLKDNPARPDKEKILSEIRRLVHTVKGASALVGVMELSQMAGRMETAVEKILHGRLAISSSVLDAMSLVVGNFRLYCQVCRNGGLEDGKFLKSTLKALDAVDKGGETGETDAPRGTCPYTDTEGETGDTAHGVSGAFQANAEDLPQNIGMPDELLEGFFQEADEHLEEIGRILDDLNETVKEPEQLSVGTREKIRRLRRCVHTLKGSGAIVGLKEFSGFAHAVEDLLDWLFESASELNLEIVKMIADSAGVLEGYLESPEKFPSGMLDELALAFKAESGKIIGPEPDSEECQISEEDMLSDVSGSGVVSTSSILDPPVCADIPVVDVPGRDEQASLRQTRSRFLRVDMEEIDGLVNLAGEIMIASGALEKELTSLAGIAEELEIAGERLKNLARDLNSRFEVKALEQFSGVASSQGASGSELFKDFDDLELDRYSKFNVMMRALDESAVDVATLSARLSESCGDLDGRLDRQKVVSGEIRDRLMGVRMVPMSVLSRRLKRTVAETCAALGKKAELAISGEKTELDRLVWEKLADPLMHLLRNAVDHGIESPEKRKLLGKPESGMLRLSVSREGSLVAIKVSDDGAGIDYDAIRASEEWKELFGDSDSASEDMLADFIFRPGFSTSGEIGEISGRGVGLDVVRENVRELKGHVSVFSQKGRGVEFIIALPLTLASARVFLFKAAGRVFAFPLSEIREIVRIGPELVKMNSKRWVRIGEKEMPLFFLEELLDGYAKDLAFPPSVIGSLAASVRFGDESAAIFVDELIEQKEVVVKSLGSHLKHVPGVAGCVILGDGSVAPILNTPELLRPASKSLLKRPPKKGTRTEDAPAEILVVDDSVSIRGVVSRMITSRGWTTRTAVNGMDALEKLREKTSDLVVLDIEMPRMNGFECLSAIKSHDEFKRIPVVMLTSRTASKHRKKASSLGASGFVVKPYDETEFAMLIQSLLENPERREG